MSTLLRDRLPEELQLLEDVSDLTFGEEFVPAEFLLTSLARRGYRFSSKRHLSSQMSRFGVVTERKGHKGRELRGYLEAAVDEAWRFFVLPTLLRCGGSVALRDVQRVLGLTETAVRSRVSRKALPAHNVSGRLVFKMDELAETLLPETEEDTMSRNSGETVKPQQREEAILWLQELELHEERAKLANELRTTVGMIFSVMRRKARLDVDLYNRIKRLHEKRKKSETPEDPKAVVADAAADDLRYPQSFERERFPQRPANTDEPTKVHAPRVSVDVTARPADLVSAWQSCGIGGCQRKKQHPFAHWNDQKGWFGDMLCNVPHPMFDGVCCQLNPHTKGHHEAATRKTGWVKASWLHDIVNVLPEIQPEPEAVAAPEKTPGEIVTERPLAKEATAPEPVTWMDEMKRYGGQLQCLQKEVTLAMTRYSQVADVAPGYVAKGIQGHQDELLALSAKIDELLKDLG
jgi:hypothetical protein